MSIVRIESIPQTWTESDSTFFAIVARLFRPEFAYGASVMLAGFDTETLGSTETGTASAAESIAVSAADADASRPLVPVVVRRSR
jgi:hypothetical protein